MSSLNLLLKPVSGSCNLRCKYCFYTDETKKRATTCFGTMSEETAAHIISKSLAAATTSCHFGFQGGEPMLRGLPFYQRFMELCRQYNVNHAKLTFSIQTNATLIDETWAAFFRENQFLVGVSLDGDKALHDRNRTDESGRGSFQRIMQAIEILNAYGVPHNVLTVVTAQTARRIEHVYQFFKKHHLWHQQYIPCLDPLGETRGHLEYSLTPVLYGKFLCRLFDLWYRDYVQGQQIAIRYFENLAAILMGARPESCGMNGVCRPQLVVEADGSVYPCDFYMMDDYCLGNFCTDSFDDFQRNLIGNHFVEESKQGLTDCLQCRYFCLCRGGCRRDRQAEDLHHLEKNYFCQSYQMFFEYAIPRLVRLVQEIHPADTR